MPTLSGLQALPVEQGRQAKGAVGYERHCVFDCRTRFGEL